MICDSVTLEISSCLSADSSFRKKMESEMKCNVSEKWSPMMPKGLDFEVSHHPLTMRQVVNLIIAMERFKDSGSESVMSTEFRDEHLLDMMLDSVVEGNHTDEILFQNYRFKSS